jgi:hypothetical protein
VELLIKEQMKMSNKMESKGTEQTRVGTPAWKRVSRGIPVEAGKNWVTGLTHEQRVQAMFSHENYWKQKYNSNRGTVGGHEGWTRG